MARLSVRLNVADFEALKEASDAVRNVMERAGVLGEPEFWFVTESWRPAPAFTSPTRQSLGQ